MKFDLPTLSLYLKLGECPEFTVKGTQEGRGGEGGKVQKISEKNAINHAKSAPSRISDNFKCPFQKNLAKGHPSQDFQSLFISASHRCP
jgi:hypothetical protein